MADGFWAFSLAFYDDEAVQAACLTLQDAHGGDVNVMLYLLFRALGGDAFDADGVRALDAGVAPWREEVVRAIRTVRRALKERPYLPDAEAQENFRAKVKKVELDAEKLQQLALEAGAPSPDRRGLAPHAAARLSLAAYGEALGGPFPEGLSAVFLGRLEAVA